MPVIPTDERLQPAVKSDTLRLIVVAVVIAVAWFVAMGVSRNGNASTIMAVTALALCVVVALTRTFDGALIVPRPRLVAIGTAAAALMVAGTYGGFALLQSLFPRIKDETSALYAYLNGHDSRLVGVALVTAVVFAEEILWRGVFQSFVASHVRRPVWIVLVCASVYAGTLTLFGSPLLVLTGFACGIFWSGLRSWSGSVIPPLIAHVVWDVVLSLVPLTV